VGLGFCQTLLYDFTVQGKANEPERIPLRRVRDIQEVEDKVSILLVGEFQVFLVSAAGQVVVEAYSTPLSKCCQCCCSSRKSCNA
jgi:hypothetical protein